MRKIAIVIAAVTGISAVAGTTYVYTTDTCLTDSCRAEKERQRQAQLDQEWQNISENVRKKGSVIAVMKEDITPLINDHFQAIHRRIERSVIERGDCAPGQWHNLRMMDGSIGGCYEYDQTEQNQNERNRQALISRIDAIESKADLLYKRFSIFLPKMSPEEKRIFLSENSEFDNDFLEYLNEFNQIVEGDVIQEHRRAFADLQTGITNSLRRINSLEAPPNR